MVSRRSSIYLSMLIFCSRAAFLPPTMLHAQQGVDAVVQEARQRLEAASGGGVEMTQSSVTNLATFIAAAPGKPIPTFASPAATLEERGRKFLELYGEAFGILAPEHVQLQRVDERDEVGMEHVRFRQMHRGVPVTGGELTVHLRGTSVTAVTAKTLPDLEMMETKPTISPRQALAVAHAVLAKHLGVTDATLSAPRLEIFNRGLLEGVLYPTHLAWFIEATKLDVREFIWIDAQRGVVLLHFSQLTDAKSRSIYDANDGSILPGALCRSEGDPSSGDTDCDTAYNFSGDTYDYFFSQHGRDSYDGAGAPLVSTVHYCPSPAQCPYKNAFWNGTQMVYGEGFSAADDVDAHELTHAVTEKSANLFYYMQSGALNESFSDIFGETVDLTNSGGTDTSGVRWQMGEDIPGIGAIRNMMDPTLFGDPGKVSDAQFVCATPGNDGGGVHTNSGVPNHAYALMADGGTYNGHTISGIGLTKAGKIQYRTLAHYLVSGSDFLDNYTAVQQSCADLVGTAGITTADCVEVKKALDAVEMANVVCGQPTVPEFCPIGQTATNLFFDDLENTTSGNWTTATLAGGNHWLDDSVHALFGGCTGSPDIYCAGFTTSGANAFWGYNRPDVSDSTVAMTSDVTVPAGGAFLQFNHSYGFENDVSSSYDGGVVEYSTNGGTTWTDAGSLISAGAAYNGIINSSFGNPLGGRNAFVRESFGYTASQLNLESLVGQNVRFRFRIGTDNIFDDYGWFIDDVKVYTCATPSLSTLRINNVSRAEGNSGTSNFVFTVTLSPASTSPVTVKYATANGAAKAGSDYTAKSGTLTFAAGQTSKTIAVAIKGDTTVEPNETFFVNLSAPNGATILDGQGMGTILNDDGPVLRVNDVSRAEGNAGTSNIVFTVKLTPASTSPVTVKYATANGAAKAGSDYTAKSGTLTFAAGQTSKTVAVAVKGDTAVEPNETFKVNLSGAVGASIFDSQGVGTILNDDGSVLRINDVSRAEGNSGTSNIVFTVKLTPASTSPVTVKYATANGAAKAGSDYTAKSGTLTFAAGQTSKTVAVAVKGDTAVEPNETFKVNLSGAVGVSIFDSQGVGTILNDD